MTSMELIGLGLLLVGLLLAGIEMTMPGFGIAGVTAVVSLSAGVILSANSIGRGIMIVAVLVAILALMLFVVMQWLKKRKGAPWVLEEDVKGERNSLDLVDLRYLVGSKGTALTDLRPAGRGRLEGEDYDVLSDGTYIAKGSAIYVAQIHDRKIIVKESVE